MKYNELLKFEPITQVVKFSQTHIENYQRNLVKTFVFSDAFKNHLLPLMVRNIDLGYNDESFGLQVVGNYGTGKSHIMSLVSLIAENAELLELIKDEKPKTELKKIAGKFKVLRFELGNTESLWDVVCFKIEEYLLEIGINFSFDSHGPIPYFERIQLMMAEFEDKFPEKGFLIVIDEMLAYLKGRSATDKLNQDLQVLQALGQSCDKSKFKFVFGVQESLYRSPDFHFAADMLNKVNDRYNDIQITKEDVAFIVKNRLLKKDAHQKQKIKEHLEPFLGLFSDMHARTQEYVDLFPVHPSYFENFEKIRIGKSQREILKTLSEQFKNLLEKDIPADNPGLLTYDKYWDDVQNNQDLMALPDVRTVKRITDTITDKIDTYFTGSRLSKKVIAKRIANACAIKILQHELDKQNGTNSELLVDDLCLTDKLADDREFLIDIIDSTSGHIIKATSGQYFDKDSNNGEFHLRVEGGINFDQQIKDYAANMSESLKDDAFFKFLEINLPLGSDTYRTGFKIWEHSIVWESHKSFRDGYIFFGNPNEKSTTHPRQHFYMYFMPIFDNTKKKRNKESDEIYFTFDDLSQDFKDVIILYGASLSLSQRADSTQKPLYKQKSDELQKKARVLFDNEYTQVVKVEYQGIEQSLNGYSLPGKGATKEQVFSDVTSLVLSKWFEEERPNFPKFTQLTTPITKENFLRLTKQALLKITNPNQANRDGEGILSGLGLWIPGKLDFSNSPFAKSIIKQLKDKGNGQVLNRDEIIEFVEKSDNIWLSKDFQIEAELEFIVLATLAALGEIEIKLQSGKTINSTNLQELKDVSQIDFYNFSHIKPPVGINLAILKNMFIGILGRDLSGQLKDESTYVSLKIAAHDLAKRTVTLLSKINDGFIWNGIEIISKNDALDYKIQFTAFSGFCDKIATYTSEARIKNFQFTMDELTKILETKPLLEKVEKQLDEIDSFKFDISYLQQCKQYIIDIDFKDRVMLVINRLADVLTSDDLSKIKKYQIELTELKNEYADWYLKQYLKYRISQTDETKKIALLDSDEKAICDILKDADFLSSAQYNHILEKLNKLIVSDNKVNKELILTAPFQDFDPKEYEKFTQLSIKDAKSSLDDLLSIWTQTLKETLDDPIVKQKIELLSKSEVKLLSEFQTGSITIDRMNALNIRNAIMNLHEGLEKIELTVDSLKTTFNKPLTPDEAVNAFRNYVDNISNGKDRNKIRIILK